MKTIVFVTSNMGKIAYARDLLKNTQVIPYTHDLIEPRAEDVRAIAEVKVKQAYEKVQVPCIAMDIGFYIRALKGFPKTYVNHALETIGIEGILQLMADKTDRYCEFKECLTYYDGHRMVSFESTGPACLATSIRGKDREDKLSDLWYIVQPLGLDQTLAELNPEDFDLVRKSGETSSLSQFGAWFDLETQGGGKDCDTFKTNSDIR